MASQGPGPSDLNTNDLSDQTQDLAPGDVDPNSGDQDPLAAAPDWYHVPPVWAQLIMQRLGILGNSDQGQAAQGAQGPMGALPPSSPTDNSMLTQMAQAPPPGLMPTPGGSQMTPPPIPGQQVPFPR